MTPKERVRTTLRHEQPDRAPVGEHEIEFSVIEEALGRPTFYRAKAKYDMAPPIHDYEADFPKLRHPELSVDHDATQQHIELAQDTHTCNHKPERFDRWVRIAQRLAREQ